MRTAIVVDDEPITRMDLREMLVELDFKVVGEASDGFDAIEVCRYYNPDVVLMDIKMPIFDGLSSAETIINENLAGCVVLLTAFGDKEFIEKAKQIGVSGYLVKPVEERFLLPTIEIALTQSARYNDAQKNIKIAENKLNEKIVIDRAKAILAIKNKISESKAYAEIQKLSMDKRCAMAEIAKIIVNNSSEREIINKAKTKLMKEHNISESTAYKKIQELSSQKNCSIEKASNILISKYNNLEIDNEV